MPNDLAENQTYSTSRNHEAMDRDRRIDRQDKRGSALQINVEQRMERLPRRKSVTPGVS